MSSISHNNAINECCDNCNGLLITPPESMLGTTPKPYAYCPTCKALFFRFVPDINAENTMTITPDSIVN